MFVSRECLLRTRISAHGRNNKPSFLVYFQIDGRLTYFHVARKCTRFTSVLNPCEKKLRFRKFRIYIYLTTGIVAIRDHRWSRKNFLLKNTSIYIPFATTCTIYGYPLSFRLIKKDQQVSLYTFFDRKWSVSCKCTVLGLSSISLRGSRDLRETYESADNILPNRFCLIFR